MKFDAQIDCTQREIVCDICWLIYRTHGGSDHSFVSRFERLAYFFHSQHPTEQEVLKAAEAVFEIFYGDTPDYSDDDEGDYDWEEE